MMTPPRELTPDEQRQRDQLVEELTALSAALDKTELRAKYLRRGEVYEALKALGMTRRELGAVAGLKAVSVDWGAGRARDHRAGATTSAARRGRRQNAAS
jgi:hypothetical protein